MKFGFNGLASRKKRLIQRMEDHIKADELIRLNGYLYQTETSFKGCAITCLAFKDITKPDPKVISWTQLKYIDFGYKKLDSIYDRVDKLLNIKNIAICIDVIHEDTPIEKGFNIKLLNLINPEVDYTDFVSKFITHLLALKKEIHPYVDKKLQHLHAEDEEAMSRRDALSCIFYYWMEELDLTKVLDDLHIAFLEFLEAYNDCNSRGKLELTCIKKGSDL